MTPVSRLSSCRRRAKGQARRCQFGASNIPQGGPSVKPSGGVAVGQPHRDDQPTRRGLPGTDHVSARCGRPAHDGGRSPQRSDGDLRDRRPGRMAQLPELPTPTTRMTARDQPGVAIDVLDVFADGPGGGNPAPIALHGDGLSDHDMQAIARDHGQECGFVVAAPAASGCDLALRFWVPEQEMSMCGHATVAAVWLLATRRLVSHPADLRLHTLSGPVQAGCGTVTAASPWRSANLPGTLCRCPTASGPRRCRALAWPNPASRPDPSSTRPPAG